MLRTLTLAAAAILMFATLGVADEASVKKCLSSVDIVKEMRANSDSTEKELGLVDKLLGVSESLCKDDATEDAEELLDVARGIMATE